MNTVNAGRLARCRSSLAVLAALMLLACDQVPAATITSQTTGGNWSDPAAWAGGVVPGPNDNVVIAAAIVTPITCDVNAACSNLSINTSCQINIANDITLTANGTTILNAAGGVIATGTGSSKLVLAGTINQSFTGAGTYGNLEISNLVGFVQTPVISTVGLAIAPGCTFAVDSGAYLQQGNNSQRVVGAGNFMLADGATLGIKDAAGIISTGGGSNGFIRVSGTRTFGTGASYIYNGTTAQTTGTGLPATVNNLTVSNSAGVTLSGNVAVTGTTKISAGTLSLVPAASLTAGAGVTIAAGGTLDVSGLGASATYTLAGSATLMAGGTGTAKGVSAAAINGGASGTVDLGSQPIVLTCDGSHPALYISQGTLSLNGNAFTVNTTNGAGLSAGNYVIVQQAAGNIVSSGTFSVSGTAIGSGMSGAIQISGTNVNLVVAPLQLAITSVNGGVSPSVGTSFNVIVQVQGAGGVPGIVSADTVVTLSLTNGTGALGGTLTGTILAGTSSVTIGGVTYSKVETNVVLSAARISGDSLLAGNSAPFSVSGGAAATLVLTSGNNQSGLALTNPASPFVVTVTDAGGNPVGGTTVTFAVASVPAGATAQSLSVTNATTSANGQASSVLTFGNVSGIYTVTASSSGLSNSPVTFTATATANLTITSVNGGINPVAGSAFSVVVQTAGFGGTPVNVSADSVVTLSRTGGTGTFGGTLSGTILAGTSSVTITNVTYTKMESGVVLTATRTSGDTLTAGNSAAFMVVAGAAVNLVLTSGNNQSALALTNLASPFVVTVTDAYSNLVSGASVTFAIATVPGSATGQILSITNAITGTNGQAASTLTLGNSVGVYTVTATSAGLVGSPVTFTATATANLAITSVNGGTNPAAGNPFSVVVKVQGAAGAAVNVLTDTVVTLSRTTGTGTLGGTLTGTILAGTSSVTFTNVTYTKAESGVVLTATRTSGDTLTAGNSAAFTVVAGAAANLALTSGNNQSGVTGGVLASPFVVTVTDASGNLVGGASVTFAITTVPGGAAGQSLTVTNATTAASGQASSTLTLGSVVGTYTVTATSAGLVGSPVTFTATATAKLAITSVNGGTNPAAGIAFSVVVQAQNAGGTQVNAVTDTVVTLSRTTGTGTLGGTLTGTILAGTSSVTFTNVTYTKAESGIVLTATRTSGDIIVSGNSAAFTVVAGAATTLTLTSGNNQTGKRLTALASPLVVTVTDAYANPVSGRSVTFAIASVPTVPATATGQTLGTPNATTAASGQASSTFTFGSVAGTYTITATSAGLAGSLVTFTAVANSGNYTLIAAVTNDYQICFKCHTAYSWLGGTPPNGLSANGTATTPVETDVAAEFSPKNKSGHPVVTGLNNYPNSTGNKPLVTSELKAPWNVNVGSQTMLCSDCHDATTTNYVASATQGPHGSANPFMLRGPNATLWPTPTSFTASWCANCHNDTSHSMDGHANHHSAGGCYRCHVVIPHGSAMSRLLADRDGSMPARYAYNNDKTTVYITSFTKATGSYGEGNCRTSCGQHSSGSSTSMENW